MLKRSCISNQDEPMKAAVLYARVSTARQAQEGVSQDVQVARARAWCQSMGYQIAGEYQDNGISGKRADNRPGLQKALETACGKRRPGRWCSGCWPFCPSLNVTW
jgi:site-specific DNA recombinase